MKYELGKNKGMPSELSLVKRPTLTEQRKTNGKSTRQRTNRRA